MLGLCGCRCANVFDIQTVIGIVPFNFFQKYTPCNVGQPAINNGLNAHPQVVYVQPNTHANDVRYLVKTVAIYYKPVLGNASDGQTYTSTFTADVNTGAVVRVDTVAPGTYHGLFYPDAQDPNNWNGAVIPLIGELQTIVGGGLVMVLDGTYATCTVTLSSPAYWSDAAAAAAALLDNVTLLSPLTIYSAIDASNPTTAHVPPNPPYFPVTYTVNMINVNFGYSADGIAPGSTQRVQTLVVSNRDAVSGITWPAGSGPVLITNPAMFVWPYSDIFTTTPPAPPNNYVGAAAHGTPGYAWGSIYLNSPTALSGQLTFSFQPSQQTQFVISAKSAIRIPGNYEPNIAAWDLTAYDFSVTFNPPLAGGEHIFLPTDLGSAYGFEVIGWGGF